MQKYLPLGQNVCTICWFMWIFCPLASYQTHSLHTFGTFMQKLPIFAAANRAGGKR